MKDSTPNPFDHSNWLNDAQVVSEIRLQCYRVKELCHLYNMSNKTFNRYIQPIKDKLGERMGHAYNVWQVRMIFGQLGLPAAINEMERKGKLV